MAQKEYLGHNGERLTFDDDRSQYAHPVPRLLGGEAIKPTYIWGSGLLDVWVVLL